MNKINKLIHCNPVVAMPKEVIRRKNMILLVEIISTGILDILSFSIKGAQYAITAKLNLLAFIFIILYFLRDVLQATIQTFTNSQKNRFNEQQDSFIIENVGDISNTVRGKVLSQDNEFSKIMTNSEVILVMKEFIGYIWQFIIRIPTAISNIVTAIILSIGIIISEFLQTKDLKLTIYLSAILLICIIVFAILYSIRFKIRKNYREKHRKLRKENEVLFNDIKNIEPLITEEFTYRVNLLVENIRNKRATEKDEYFNLNVVQVLRTIVLAIFMIGIILIKLYYVGGINKLSIVVITDILAISSVYSTILNKVDSILRNFEEMANLFKDAEAVKPDFDKIMAVNDAEKKVKFSSDECIDHIRINPFIFSYSSAKNSVYKLQNTTSILLEKGKSYLVSGHTGCGKSTLMHLLTGKIKLDESPMSYSNQKSKATRAYLASIMHESNGRLGSNSILEELIFSKKFSTLNKSKMVEILHGTRIYEDIMRNLGLTKPNDDKVLEYLRTTSIVQYSSGQKQRLAIVKVLYNLSSKHKVVVFDEATNALDNETAKSVLKFMADYCQKDQPRIVFFVTHQVDITKQITNASIEFHSKMFPIIEIGLVK